jgi:hypothetical protein
MMNADEILYGPDSFYCEKFSCRMLKERCVDRQMGLPKRTFSNMSVAVCSDCPQGALIKNECECQTERFESRKMTGAEKVGIDVKQVLDEFEVLDRRVESLIELARNLKQERDVLSVKLESQQKEVIRMLKEIEALHSKRDRHMRQTATMMEKIKLVDLA